MTKAELRLIYLEKRQALSREKSTEYSHGIARHFLSLCHDQTQSVHIYLPIAEKNEIDTWPIIRLLWERGIDVAVPVMAGRGTFISRHLDMNTSLKVNSWLIPEPFDSAEADENEIDIIVMPLLAFDTRGYRVGYGGGYYDRFLAGFSTRPLTVGLSFFPPVSHIDNIHEGDIPLDCVILPDGIIRFS